MDGLQYTIEVDDSPAVAGTQRVNKALDSVSEKARDVSSSSGFQSLSTTMAAIGQSAQQHLVSATQAMTGFSAATVKASEATLATVGAFKILSTYFSEYATATTGATGITEQFVASLRAARIAASAVFPELFGGLALAGTTVGLGIAVEETTRLINARARLIEQQAFISASTGVPFRGVEYAQNFSYVTNAPAVEAAAFSLQSRLNNQETSASVHAALSRLNVSPSVQGGAYPDTIRQIIEGFDSIEDPVERARTAIQLFGKDTAEKILPSLDSALADSARSFDEWSFSISDASRDKILTFKRDMDFLGGSLFNIAQYFREASLQARQFVSVVGADVYQRLRDLASGGLEFGVPIKDVVDSTKTPNEKAQEEAERDARAKTSFFGVYFGNADDRFVRESKSLLSPDLNGAEIRRKELDQQIYALQYGYSRQTPAIQEELARLRKERAALPKPYASESDGTNQSPIDLIYDDDQYNVETILGKKNYTTNQLQELKRKRDEVLKLLNLPDDDPKSPSYEMEVVLSAYVKSLQSQIDPLEKTLQGIEVSKFQFEQQRSSRDRLLEARGASLGPLAQTVAGYGKSIYDATHRVAEDLNGNEYIQQVGLQNQTRLNLEGAFQARVLEYQKKTLDEMAKANREEYDRRIHYEEAIFQKRLEFDKQTLELERSTDEKLLAHENTLAGYSRDEQINELNGTRPQTVSGRLALEQRKLGIEQDYFLKTSINDLERVKRDENRQLLDLAARRVAQDDSTPEKQQKADQEFFSRYNAIKQAQAEQAREISDKYSHEIITAEQNSANASTEIVRSAQLKQFDSLKQSVESVLNSMETKGKNVFQAIADSAKVAFLSIFNQIVSSQIAAALFRVLNPGATVTFDSSGQGKGRFGGLLSGLGLGTQPVFGGDVPGVTAPLNVNSTSHDRNTAAVKSQLSGGASSSPSSSSEAAPQKQLINRTVHSGASGGGLIPFLSPLARFGTTVALASGLAFAGPGQVTAPSQGSAITSTINYDGGGSETFSSISGGDLPYSAIDHSGLTLGSESLGIPGGYNLPSLPVGLGGIGGGRGGFGGGLGRLGTGNLKDLIYNSGEIQVGPGVASSAAGISNSLGGGVLGNLAGGAAGFASSGGGALVGSTLLLSGLQGPTGVGSAVKTTSGGALLGANIGSKIPGLGIEGGALVGAGAGLVADGLRRGGLAGTFEDAAGGAAIGFQFGGPVGAAIGAAVGAGVGLIREFFFKGDRQHTKDLVKQIYGLSINDQMADQIIQLAKQHYGGQISVAVRSQEVRDLLKLYAESIGSSAQKQFVADKVHSASLIEANGQLTQGAVYDNGQAYTYASSLPTLNGISSSSLPTVARNAGSPTIQVQSLQLQLNGQSASDVLAGQVGRVATPSFVQNASISAQQSSIGRSSATTLALAPSAIVA